MATPFNFGSWKVHQVPQVYLAHKLPVKIPGMEKKNPINAALYAFESFIKKFAESDLML